MNESSVTSHAPLSIAQHGLWFVSQVGERASAAYNVTLAFRTSKPLQQETLQRAWNAVCQRHPLLGARIEVVDYQPRFCNLECPETADVVLAHDSLLDAAIAQVEMPFDFTRSPLNRVVLVDAPGESGLVITLPHLIVDGQSAEVLMDDLQAYYAAESEGAPVDLAAVPMDQRAVAAGEAAAMQGDGGRTQLTSILNRLSGVTEIEAFSRLADSGERAGARVGYASANLHESLTAQIRSAAHRLEATPASIYLAATTLLAWRYFQCEDFPFTVPVSHRDDDTATVNYLSNLHIGRARIHPRMTVQALVHASMDELFDMIDAAAIPLPTVLRSLKRHASGGIVRQPGLGFNFQRTENRSRKLGDVALTPVDLPPQRAKDCLLVDILDSTTGTRCALQFDPDVIDESIGQAMLDAYVEILTGLCGDPSRGVREIGIARALASESVDPQIAGDADVVQMFRQQAELHPAALALECEGRQMTYRHLDALTDGLAVRLEQAGAGPERMVAVCLPRGTDAVVAILAVLKAGACYVPLDPSLPSARCQAILEGIGIDLVIGTPSSEAPETRRIPLYATEDGVQRMGTDSSAHASRLAYVIHTSGSTGRPKPVGISVEVLSGHIRACIDRYGLSSSDRVLQFASNSLDPSIEQIFGALCVGATLVLRGEAAWSPDELTEALRSNSITVADIPTVYWESYRATRFQELQTLPLRLLLIGGEAARSAPPPDLPFDWMNAYGPTEACITATLLDADDLTVGAAAPLPIGRPLPGVIAYVLDASLFPVPVGAVGELCLGGSHLARGYLAQPSATAAAFVPDPFGVAGGRLYRTGDLVRQLPNGILQFIGRVDRQIKIRGLRIEPAEVEAALQAVDGVANAAAKGVLIDGEMRLVAYVVAPNLSIDALRMQLEVVLPTAMTPTAWVFLDQLPIGPSGKVDYAALPSPERSDGGKSAPSTAPRNELERALVLIWSQALKAPAVGIHDNFFSLGGHSLLATQLVARMRQELGKRVTLRTLFDAPSIAQLAARLEDQATPEAATQF